MLCQRPASRGRITVTDPKTGKTTVREVASTIVTEDDKHFVDLTIKGRSGKSEKLVSTTTHPFWSDSEQAWIEAGDLKPGIRLHTANGGTVELTAIRAFDKRQHTRDLTKATAPSSAEARTDPSATSGGSSGSGGSGKANEPEDARSPWAQVTTQGPARKTWTSIRAS